MLAHTPSRLRVCLFFKKKKKQLTHCFPSNLCGSKKYFKICFASIHSLLPLFLFSLFLHHLPYSGSLSHFKSLFSIVPELISCFYFPTDFFVWLSLPWLSDPTHPGQHPLLPACYPPPSLASYAILLPPPSQYPYQAMYESVFTLFHVLLTLSPWDQLMGARSSSGSAWPCMQALLSSSPSHPTPEDT